jgi:hypothetical protein
LYVYKGERRESCAYSWVPYFAKGFPIVISKAAMTFAKIASSTARITVGS